jgi:hypothetical protein
MKTAMNDIDNQDYVNAIKNLDASLKFLQTTLVHYILKDIYKLLLEKKIKVAKI